MEVTMDTLNLIRANDNYKAALIQLKEQNANLTEKDKKSEKLIGDFALKADAQNRQFSETMKQKDAAIGRLQETLEKRDERIEDLRKIIEEKTSSINELVPYKTKYNQVIAENTQLVKKHSWELELKKLEGNRLLRKINELESEIEEMLEDEVEEDSELDKESSNGIHELIQMPEDGSEDKPDKLMQIETTPPPSKSKIIESAIMNELEKGNGRVDRKTLESIDGVVFDTKSQIRTLCKGGMITLKNDFLSDYFSPLKKY